MKLLGIWYLSTHCTFYSARRDRYVACYASFFFFWPLAPRHYSTVNGKTFVYCVCWYICILLTGKVNWCTCARSAECIGTHAITRGKMSMVLLKKKNTHQYSNVFYTWQTSTYFTNKLMQSQISCRELTELI